MVLEGSRGVGETLQEEEEEEKEEQEGEEDEGVDEEGERGGESGGDAGLAGEVMEADGDEDEGSGNGSGNGKEKGKEKPKTTLEERMEKMRELRLRMVRDYYQIFGCHRAVPRSQTPFQAFFKLATLSQPLLKMSQYSAIGQTPLSPLLPLDYKFNTDHSRTNHPPRTAKTSSQTTKSAKSPQKKSRGWKSKRNSPRRSA